MSLTVQMELEELNKTLAEIAETLRKLEQVMEVIDSTLDNGLNRIADRLS